MTASMAAFTVNDTFIKSLSDEIPLFQALFVRGLFVSVLIALAAIVVGQLRLRHSRRDWYLLILRALADVGAAYFFLTALFNMPLANATAILQALPLTVTLAGVLFLGEVIGWRRIAAILVGFAGVLMIIQPGAEGFNAYSLYVVVAVGFVTVRDIAARRLSREVPSLTAAWIVAIAVTLFAAPFAVTGRWVEPSALAWFQFFGSSLAIFGGYLFSVMAMRVGDIASIMPFRYTSLLFALVLGYMIFEDWPNWLAQTGAAIVVAMGLFTWIRERRVASWQGPVR